MDNCYFVYGPPGTGKTDYLRRQTVRALERYEPHQILAVSFTRAAAYELATRLPLPEESVGTLHSLCYRELGLGEVAEAKITQWNELHPSLAVSNAKPSDTERRDFDGDELYQTVNCLRARRIPHELWPPRAANFFALWKRFKQETATHDFTDMIELGLEHLKSPPHGARVGFFDEAQDFDKLQFDLVTQWARGMERVVFAGDPNQCLFEFKGSSPDFFLSHDIHSEHKIKLAQSYRLPRAIHRYSEKWLTRLSRREPVEFSPRDADGQVSPINASVSYPHLAIEHAIAHARNGQTSMLLASCGFMLDRTADGLRERGVPFHNPYRPEEGRWNPLPPSSHGRHSSRDRLLAFLRPSRTTHGQNAREWDWQDMKLWLPILIAERWLEPGAKQRLKAKGIPDLSQPVMRADKLDFFYQLHNSLSRGNKDAERLAACWLLSEATLEWQRRLKYPTQIVKSFGGSWLLEKPRTTIGTIHCSPADEPILTTDGWGPIGSLDTAHHRLAGFYRKSNQLTWGGHGPWKNRTTENIGFQAERSIRPYVGPLIVLETDESRVRVTPNHRVLARFAPSFFEKWIVYLMRRGDWWRVGICTSGHLPYRASGLGGRLSTEQADAGWILGIYETRGEALYSELVFQGLYGVPGLTFESAKQRALTNKHLQAIHSETAVAVSARVFQLFAATGLDPLMPLYMRSPLGGNVQKRNLRETFMTSAGNLSPLSRYVLFPTIPKSFVTREKKRLRSSPLFLSGTINSQVFSGDVYGLDVPPWHYYASGGAVVHNSVKGGESDHVFLFPDLSQNAESELGHGRSDPTTRMFYVGMTRGRSSLRLGQSSGAYHIGWEL